MAGGRMSGSSRPTSPFGRPASGPEQGDMFRMSAELTTNSDDPNASFELRDMVSVAASYFERGMIDDAQEMLEEALGAGYSRTDALELDRRIRATHGEIPATTITPNGSAPATDPGEQFTNPLPGIDAQPAVIQRLSRDAEADIQAQRLQSAMDATMQALGLAPTFFPLYVRLAELRMAMGNFE